MFGLRNERIALRPEIVRLRAEWQDLRDRPVLLKQLNDAQKERSAVRERLRGAEDRERSATVRAGEYQRQIGELNPKMALLAERLREVEAANVQVTSERALARFDLLKAQEREAAGSRDRKGLVHVGLLFLGQKNRLQEQLKQIDPNVLAMGQAWKDWALRENARETEEAKGENHKPAGRPALSTVGKA